ncbi:DUF4158 domain-containing protein [Arthrobacter terricola]|uniref:DUF4158 domain-containing protein n=1 Tax=Arthrobacter terricola TaxID=2547396 RepID=UPI00197ACE08
MVSLDAGDEERVALQVGGLGAVRFRDPPCGFDRYVAVFLGWEPNTPERGRGPAGPGPWCALGWLAIPDCGYGFAVRVVILLGVSGVGVDRSDRLLLRFKRVVSARELAEAFKPTPEEIAWARGKTQSLLALVVRLKAYQRLGYFPKLPDIPAVVVDSMRGVLGCRLRCPSRRGRTHREAAPAIRPRVSGHDL